ncbi:helix-turn-helix domain-containing protein [Metabacillus rhizolycopersici]|uniref:Helix-turn-helix domain-containing protein n=1 Tax=Metabacillus rhizolycopersici TaxID=2875709 RepID=A0ABS7UVR4_9BACI|nr:helix-turn-helix domain-containing protein [Metabacillus rhizolycopersici]MBZ5752400.1 helix-turn-helix domain-containing protein [Metabacillus rhizolycopersici]
MEKLNFETVQRYQSFQTIEEMDQSVRGFLYKHKVELSEGTLSVLQHIWKHSVKVVGVSFAKYDYIAEQVKVSRRTVIRAVNSLEERGIIKRIPTARMNGKQGVNIVVIQAFEPIDTLLNNKSPQDVTPTVTPNKTENKQSSLCEKQIKQPINVNDTSESSQQELDSSYLPDSISQEFVQATKPFLHAIDIYKLWNRVLIAYNKIKPQKYLDDLSECIIHAFKQTVFAKKLGKIHTTFEGYFYRIVYANLIIEKRREHKHLLYDFLNGE